MSNATVPSPVASITIAVVAALASVSAASAAMPTDLPSLPGVSAAGDVSIGSRLFENGGRAANRRVEIIVKP